MKSNVAVKKCLLILITVLFIMAFGALFVACAPKGSEDSNDHEHLYRNYTYNNDATCGRDGTETATCEFCTKTDTRPSVAHPATGNHTYNTNNVCTVCGHIKSSGDNNDDTKKYKTVTFDAGDGDVSVSEKQFEVGKVMADLPVPTREGYRFVCWTDAFGSEFTSVSLMPNIDFVLFARWEKVVTKYEDDYVSLKPATEGYKNINVYGIYEGDVDKFVYVELTSDDLGGIDNVGKPNNFTLRTLDGMEYAVKSGYAWTWYQGNFETPNGSQRFTLKYGNNPQLVTISDGSGVVVRTYLLDIYVRRDYYVSLYKNIFENQPYDKVRVIENDRFPSSTPAASESNFEFDKRVYYNSSTRAYETFVYSTAITQNLNLYQTYKPVTLNATLNGGTVNGALTVTPYEKYFELPTATKDGYDFMGWKLSDGKYLTDINGFGGDKYYSKDTAELSVSAEFARTKFYYTFENDELRTQKTVPVVTYTDNTNSEIAEILHVPHNTDCALPTKSPDTTQAIFKGWQQYAKKNGGGYYTTPSDFDFNVKVTEPIALVPEYTGTLTNDPSSDIYQSAVAINSQNSYNARGTFKMYLPAKEEYTLVITPSSGMQITVNAYGKESAKNYTISAGSPYSISLNYYVYNYGSQVRAKGEVSFSVTSGSGTFTAKLVGSTGETDGRPIKLTDDNLANVGENFTVNAEKAGYTFVGWYNGETELTKSSDYTFILPNEDITYTAKWTYYTLTLNKTEGGSISSVGGVSYSNTVSFNLNGGSGSIASQTPTASVGLTYPTIPTRSGYVFGGWYENASCTGEPFDFSVDVTKTVTLYAKWISYSGSGILPLNGSLAVSVVSKSSTTMRYYAFVPLVSGSISVYTDNGLSDTYGYLYNSSKTQLATDDDSGNGSNFKITYNVTAGTLYYVRPCGYSSSGNTTLFLSAELPTAGGKSTASVILNENQQMVTAENSVTVTATTNSGYTWVGWYNGTTKLTNELSYTFAMPTSNVTYTAKWTYYTLTTNTNDSSAGSYTQKTAVKTTAGQSVTVTATTNNGYTWVGWYNGEQELTKDLSYTFPMPSSNVTYTAKWTYYTLSTNTNDSLAGSYTQKTAVKTTAGQSVTVTATTNRGYTWIGWYNGTTKLTNELSYTFAMPTSNVTYTAKWIACPVTLEKSIAQAGSVSMPSTTIVGQSTTITATTNSGYTFVGWYNGEQELTKGLSYTFPMPTSNVTYTAKWIKVTVDRSNTSAGGVTSLTGKYKVGDSVTVTATTNNGYTWVGWYNGEQELTKDLSYTFPMPSSNVTYTAKWTYYTLSTNTNDSLAGSYTQKTAVKTTAGQSVTVTATTNSGYTWVGWYNGTTKLTNELSYTFAMPTSNVTYTAKWIACPVTLEKSIAQAGSVSMPSTTIVGQSTTITATTNSGYTFVGWYNGETELTKELSYSFVMPSVNKTYTAKWEERREYLDEVFEYTLTDGKYMITGIKDKSVTKISVPGYVDKISQGAFSGCANLTSITLPFVGDSIKTSNDTYPYPFGYIFGTYSYTGGTATTQYYQESSKSIATRITYYIPTTLKNVTITGGNEIPNAFRNCSSLTSITIPNSVTSIGNCAFDGCSSLTSIVIPDGVTSIGNYAFCDCSSLTSITIPDSVTSVEEGAFTRCNSLQYNRYDKGLYLGNSTNKYVALIKAINTSIMSCTINPNTKIIYDKSFEDCSCITSIEIPNSVTYIGHWAFEDCSRLSDITIPNSVTYIGDAAFRGCSSLTSIMIPNSVTCIWYEAFGGCSILTIYCEAVSKPSGWHSGWNTSNRPVVWDYKNK